MTQPDDTQGPTGPDGPVDRQPTQALPATGGDPNIGSGESHAGWAPPGAGPSGGSGESGPSFVRYPGGSGEPYGSNPPQSNQPPQSNPSYGPGPYGGAPAYGAGVGYGQPASHGQTPTYGQTPGYGQTPVYGQNPGYGQAPTYPPGPTYGSGQSHGPADGRPSGYIPADWAGVPPVTGQSIPAYPAPATSRQRSIAGRVLAVAAVVALFAGLIGAVGGVAASRVIWPPVAPSQQANNNNGPAVFASPQPVGTVSKALLPSVVQIRVMSGGSGVTGSGFVISDEGMIATNNHVVADVVSSGADLSVVFEDGDEAKATVVGRSPSYDLAVIKVDAGAKKLKPVVLGDSDALEVGDPVIAIGAPLGLIGTVTTGIISAKNRPVTTGQSGENSYMSALQTDAAINPGNSGGPLVDMRGRVVGVNSAIASLGTSMGGQSGSIGLGFSIPVNQAKRVTKEIIDTGKATYPIIGAEIDTTYTGNGARITTVQAKSPAAQAGLKDGDIITEVDGVKVTSGVELIVKIRSNVPGGNIKLTTSTGGSRHDYSVKLGSKEG